MHAYPYMCATQQKLWDSIKKSPLAYLELKAHNKLIPSAITRGVSYASAGAGILDSTVSYHSALFQHI